MGQMARCKQRRLLRVQLSPPTFYKCLGGPPVAELVHQAAVARHACVNALSIAAFAGR
jgi:hypothetical protein